MRGQKRGIVRRGQRLALLASLPLAALLSAPLLASADSEGDSSGSATPRCMGEEATILGSPGNDRGKKKIVGTRDADVIVSFGGRDQINAKGGDDRICTGRGADKARGGAGEDQIDTGAGKDELRGNRGDDELDGGRGSDRLNGGAGEDRCRGGKGKDKKRSCELSGKGGNGGKGSKPNANDDQASTDEATATMIDVLANDEDPKGRTLKIIAVDASDAAGSAAIKGSSVEYDPSGGFEALAAGQSDSDSFTYTIKNSVGKRDSATVNVSIKGLDDPSKVTATPALFPDYSPEISDYVTRCTGDPVAVDAVAGPGNSINVDGQGHKSGASSATVPLQENQRFSFVRRTGAGDSTHHVRCLPADFPEWSFERFAAPEQQWYLATVGDYVLALDGNGVPVWWYDDGGAPVDAKYLADGTFTWATNRATPNARYDIRGLDGSLVREMRTVGTRTDGHDIQLLDNGNYLLMSYKQRAGVTVDLTEYGGPANGTVTDAELQEIDPDDPGTPVWTWNSKDHIALEETDHWFDDFVFPFGGPTGPFDIVHINSAEMMGNSVVISMRHTDGVYKINKATGDIVWKLGGTETDESLTVVDDPHGQNPFGGQHDARILPDGTLSAFDNGQTYDRPPRAVRYAIDETAKTATYLESVKDTDIPTAICCGSARRSDSGSWVIGWGALPAFNPIAEYAADGTRTFKLSFSTGFSYRGHPVPFGELGRAALRSGMDSQHPR